MNQHHAPLSTKATSAIPADIAEHVKDTAIALYENAGFGDGEADDAYRVAEILSTSQTTLPKALEFSCAICIKTHLNT